MGRHKALLGHSLPVVSQFQTASPAEHPLHLQAADYLAQQNRDALTCSDAHLLQLATDPLVAILGNFSNRVLSQKVEAEFQIREIQFFQQCEAHNPRIEVKGAFWIFYAVPANLWCKICQPGLVSQEKVAQWRAITRPYMVCWKRKSSVAGSCLVVTPCATNDCRRVAQMLQQQQR